MTFSFEHRSKIKVIADYYKLREQPFGVTPDTRYLYLSPTHREAFASLVYGVQSGRGFASIIARPGMGKTLLLFQLLHQLRETARTVFLFQALGGPDGFLRSLLRDLGVKTGSRNVSQMQFQLNECLLAEARQGKRLIVVVDEAQNLPDSVLELVRMFSNFETPREKLMQIILSGQPQLAEKLASPGLVQLRQRISVIARLQPFTPQETNQYIAHRLRVAGYDFKTPIFSRDAAAMIAEQSQGIPRNINNICFNALSLGYVLRQKTIEEKIICEVVADLDVGLFREERESATASEASPHKIRPSPPPLFAGTNLPGSHGNWLPRTAWGAGFLALLLLAASIGLWGSHRSRPVLSVPEPASQMHPSASAAPVVAVPSPVPQTPVVQPRSPAQDPRSGPAMRPVAAKPAMVPTTISASAKSPVIPPPSHPATKAATFESLRDPAELWREVGEEKVPAEVSLAKLYLEGTVVPQSCEQARLLLLAASRKGSKDADDLLTDGYSRRCQ